MARLDFTFILSEAGGDEDGEYEQFSGDHVAVHCSVATCCWSEGWVMTGPRPAPMEPLVTAAGRPQCCSHNYATIELGGPGWSVANKVNKLKRRPS